MKRSGPIKRTTRVKPVNAKRRVSAFARAYGSRARVAWVKARPCLVCGYLPSENAHIETGGMGRKADAHLIVPLCRFHHYLLHQDGRVTFEKHHSFSLVRAAASTEAAWIAQQTKAA